ncbi:Transglycosylase SLT domain-containing protein [Ruegeria halocynthiae]|uniref:Transglycosylase SLT domain-containing protein n=1 Tax=Ruegeria halocynthiae TaxID=985054 RepID=A0A1H3DSL1_9RHOB|nr:transglycosylase SLT domain-containing protein [Ruegeria halocynthiae]SDX69523.1 Transglycosylase SLT domain-containing protein [Ruegeria halocynthiae]
MPIQKLLTTALLAQTLLAQAGHATPSAHMAALCDRAAQRAAQSEGVPLKVLRAIARVETGRALDGRLEPWPWTVNREGKGYWFASEVEAKSYVFDIFRSGVRSFDVGCFQINYRWHGKAFRSIDAMFDPDENATYAARFLTQLYAELGSWPAAAGAYHSRTQHHAAAYTDRFQTVLAQLDGADISKGRDPFTASASPLIPLNTPALDRNALGSLVPGTGTATAFITFN